jgi:hypothetical protein
MYKSFEEKKHTVNKNGNRHDIRKSNVDINKAGVGEEIKKPIHLKEKKKELLKEKVELLKKKSSKSKGL